MKTKNFRYFVGDFETTVYEQQNETEVWASALVEFDTDDVIILHSIEETFEYICNLEGNNICIYYHNLKFDGAFWISYLIEKLNYTQAFKPNPTPTNENEIIQMWDKEMPSKSFKYSISDMGQWYTITIKKGDKLIELRDSLKLLPFSVRKIGDSFGTKHKKLDMEYEGYRYAGCEITEKEKQYIANDVLVVKEALEIMFREGHSKLTIGSCCLAEFKATKHHEEYERLFPDLTKFILDVEQYGSENADKYIRRSYKGGWCYVVKGKEDKIKKNGLTADVNSLYPSSMSSESGNAYPVGEPHFWKGNYIPEEIFKKPSYFFVRIKTRFYIKENMLPFIQIKGNLLYHGTECLETSDVYDAKNKRYLWAYKDNEGNVHDTKVTLTLTCTDFALFLEHYDTVELEILDGCYFDAEIGLFDKYIEKYKKQKLENKGALRELAKLFLNNLYGKMASSTDSSFKYAYLDETGAICYKIVAAYNKKAGYIAIGSAITSYARNFTIRAAQMNYYGPNKRGFIYADTDSIHCDLKPEELKGITVHDKNFCCWKLETYWDEALFTRQKTYIEHVTHENQKKIDKPYYNVKCAGMPERAKNYFVASMLGTYLKPEAEWDDDEKKEWNSMSEKMHEWVKQKRTIKDFKRGLIIPEGKLLPKRIKGGIVLKDTSYEMR